MIELYHSKDVKTRKDHKCDLCRITIPKGTICHYESGKYDGEMFSRHTHEECSGEWSRQNKETEYDEPWGWFENEEDGDRSAWNNMIKSKYAQ